MLCGQSSENPCESPESPSYEAATSSACLDLALAGASVEKETFMMHSQAQQTQRMRLEAQPVQEARRSQKPHGHRGTCGATKTLSFHLIH